MDYAKIASQVIENVGGKQNIKSVQHCATRLRLQLKNNDLRNEEAVSDIEGVKGVFLTQSQFQIIFGSGLVNLVCDEVQKQLGIAVDTSADDEKEEKKGNALQRLVKLLSDIFVPINKAQTSVKEEVKEIEVQESTADTAEETNELYAPMKGEVLDVSKSADPAFASKAMGEGVAINPSEGVIYAPADGTISLIFPTKHAMGITLNSGIELLIHAGIDTVKMEGKGFETFVETGAKVKKGDKLLSFDMDLVKEKGYQTQTMFLVADAKGKEVEVIEATNADNDTKIMKLK